MQHESRLATLDAPVRKRLGEILIERGKLDPANLERALRLQADSGERLGSLLVTLGLCAQRDVAEALSLQLALPLVDANGYPEFPILEERVSACAPKAQITVVDDLPIVGAALLALDQLAVADGAGPRLRATLVADRFSRNGAVR